MSGCRRGIGSLGGMVEGDGIDVEARNLFKPQGFLVLLARTGVKITAGLVEDYL